MANELSKLREAELLSEVLSHVKNSSHSLLVIKYGGNAMVEPDLKENFSQDVALLHSIGLRPIVVHGGGPQIQAHLKRLGKEEVFFQGLRVTDKETMKVVQMVLDGEVNHEIVASVNLFGGKAIGLSGIDGWLIQAEKLCPTSTQSAQPVDIGQVGKVININIQFLLELVKIGLIPVISPIGMGGSGEFFNINADTVASEIASTIKANKLIILTNTPGVLDQKGNVISCLTPSQIHQLTKEGVLCGGMIPKVHAALEAVQKGKMAVHIIDGRVPHALLLELFTHSRVGTVILPYDEGEEI
ncbi:MAG: acetylglutamate kinase [Neisseriaceae bacterium]